MTYPGCWVAIDADGEGGVAAVGDLSGPRLLLELWCLRWTLDGPDLLHLFPDHANCQRLSELHLVKEAVFEGVHSERLSHAVLHRQQLLLLLLLKLLLRHLLLLHERLGLCHLLLLLLLALLLHHVGRCQHNAMIQ